MLRRKELPALIALALALGAPSAAAQSDPVPPIENVPPVCTPQLPGPIAEVGVPTDVELACTDADGDAFEYAAGNEHGGTLGTVTQPAAPGEPATVSFTLSSTFGGGFWVQATDEHGMPSAPVMQPVQAAVGPLTPICAPPIPNPLPVRSETPKAIGLSCHLPPPALPTALSYEIVTAPSNGTLEGTPPMLTYTPGIQEGSDFFEYRATYDGEGSAVVRQDIGIAPDASEPPSCVPQLTSVKATQTVTIGMICSDPDGDVMTFTTENGPDHGTLSEFADGPGPGPGARFVSWLYDPDDTYAGSDGFDVVADDGFTPSSAPVQITVRSADSNLAPGCTGFGRTVREGATTTITVFCADGDGDRLTFAASDPQNGTLGDVEIVVDEPGELQAQVPFTADTGFVGVGGFTASVSDGQADSPPAPVMVSIVDAASNTPPTCSTGITVPVEPGVPYALVGGCSDAEGDPLEITILSGPDKGQISEPDADGIRHYTADPGATGTDTIAFQANDGLADSNVGEVTFSIGGDTTPPDPPTVTITSGPGDPTTATDAVFAFTADPGTTLECRLDEGTFAACDGPTGHRYDGPLAEGEHTFTVRADDGAGGTATDALTWTVDLTAPDTAIDAAPDTVTGSTGATFAFASEPGTTFECRLDDAAGFSACGGDTLELTGLGEGDHTLAVRAVDPAGNADASPASHTWTVDLTAPQTTIETAPDAVTGSTDAAFTYASEPGATFECRLDGDPFAGCPPDGRSFAGLSEGEHVFDVRALDEAGNADGSPATHTWTVDLTGPETTIDAAPDTVTGSTDAAFAYTSEPGATFECRVDDAAAFTACGDGAESLAGLAEGAHTFRVRALDAVGNAGAPATFDWRVDLTPPVTRITSGPKDASETLLRTARLAGGADEPGASFECRRQGPGDAALPDTWDACTFAGLAFGEHTAQIRAIDPAGNADPTPEQRTWSVLDPTTVTEPPPVERTGTVAPDEPFTTVDEPTPEQPVGLTVVSPDGGDVEVTERAAPTTPAPDGFSLLGLELTIEVPPPADPDEHLELVFDLDPSVLPEGIDHTNLDVFRTSGGETVRIPDCPAEPGSGDLPCVQERSALDGGGAHLVVWTDHASDWNFGKDETPPEVTLAGSGPQGETTERSARFVFSSEPGATFRCRLDGGAFRACSSPHVYDGLGAGEHTFAVQARDRAGNASRAASRTWTVVEAAEPAAPAPAPDAGAAQQQPNAGGPVVPARPFVGGMRGSGLYPAKLQVRRARVRDGRLDVLAFITGRASGRVKVTFHAAGRKVRFTVPVNAERRFVRFKRRLPPDQARLGTGIVTLRYAGDDNTLPRTVRLRAARNRAQLVAGRPRVVGGRLVAGGRIADRAPGVVRVRYVYVDATGTPRRGRVTGAIEDGRWSVRSAPLPPGARIDAYASIQYTGDIERRIRGEMRAYRVDTG